jgi:hypothetical protein
VRAGGGDVEVKQEPSADLGGGATDASGHPGELERHDAQAARQPEQEPGQGFSGEGIQAAGEWPGCGRGLPIGGRSAAAVIEEHGSGGEHSVEGAQ